MELSLSLSLFPFSCSLSSFVIWRMFELQRTPESLFVLCLIPPHTHTLVPRLRCGMHVYGSPNALIAFSVSWRLSPTTTPQPTPSTPPGGIPDRVAVRNTPSTMRPATKIDELAGGTVEFGIWWGIFQPPLKRISLDGATGRLPRLRALRFIQNQDGGTERGGRRLPYTVCIDRRRSLSPPAHTADDCSSLRLLALTHAKQKKVKSWELLYTVGETKTVRVSCRRKRRMAKANLSLG